MRFLTSGVLPCWLSTVLVAVLGPLTSGCSCEEERPYTPFSVATALPNTDLPPAQKTAKETADEVAEKALVVAAPSALRTWTVFERTLSAPRGGTFALAASLPEPDATAPASVVSWIQGPSDVHGLWLHGLDGSPQKRLVESPAFLPTDPDCSEQVALASSGSRGVTVDVTRSCGARQLPGAPNRALLVVQTAAPVPLLHALRVAPTAAGEKLEFEADTADQDGDGASDVNVTFRMLAPGGTLESFGMHWLARPAGTSRQKDTPSRAFVTRASELGIAAQRKAERGRVPAQVEALRRLYAAVCSEGGASRVSQWDGTPLSCGNMDAGLGRLTWAAVQAHIGLSEPGPALGEFERAAWFGAPPAEKERLALEKLTLAKILVETPRRIDDVRVTLGDKPAGVVQSRLAFDAKNRLWALLADQTTRQLWPEPAPAEPLPPPPLDGDRSTPAPAPAAPEFPAWSLEPHGPGDKRVAAVLPSCDRSEVQLAFVSTDGSGVPSLPLRLLAPRPGKCSRFGGGPLPAQLLGWDGPEVIVSVGGQVWKSDGKPVTHGVVSTSLGLFVHDEGSGALWRNPYFRSGLECTVSEDRKLAACLGSGLATVWEKPHKQAAP